MVLHFQSRGTGDSCVHWGGGKRWRGEEGEKMGRGGGGREGEGRRLETVILSGVIKSSTRDLNGGMCVECCGVA